MGKDLFETSGSNLKQNNNFNCKKINISFKNNAPFVQFLFLIIFTLLILKYGKTFSFLIGR